MTKRERIIEILQILRDGQAEARRLADKWNYPGAFGHMVATAKIAEIELNVWLEYFCEEEESCES